MSAYQQGPEAGGFQQTPQHALPLAPQQIPPVGAVPGSGFAPQAPSPGPRTARRSAQRSTVLSSALRAPDLIAYVATVLGVLIAAAVVDENAAGQGFGAERAWMYVTLLTIGYLVSRGLAKSGSHHDEP